MVTHQFIICISTQDWGELWTRKQRFMKKFALQGNKVLYIEKQMHFLGLIRNFAKEWKRIYLWLFGPRKKEENLYVYTPPILLPFFQMFPMICWINNLFLSFLIKQQTKKLFFKNPILWIYPPYNPYLIGRFNEKLVIYECVDEYSASQGLVKKKTIKLLEKLTIQKSDLVIVTAQALYDSKKDLAKNIYLIPNAAEIEHFKKSNLNETKIPEEMLKIKKPILGFLGTIQYWIDFDLIRFIAFKNPGWSIVMIGPIGRLAEIEKIKSLPNVYLLGRKPYQEVPNYVKAFDVCLNPYKIDEVSKSCSPLKLYEYLASGKPIVSVDMPEARKFKNLIEIGLDYEDFLEKIQKVLDCLPEDKAKIEMRIREAEKHSWDSRFLELEKILEKYL
jgi:glycosyltransferase involved in cell wall biosynthesis